MPGFSKSQDIVDTTMREQQRIINEQSQTSQLASEKIAQVVGQLMKAQDPDFDISIFNFLVFDDKQPNAFFLDSEFTKDGKHIIAVSQGLINECRSEDEFAAILGHELGHFTKKEAVGRSRNTVFEEQGADMWAVNLLHKAGYNPSAMGDISGRLFTENPQNNLLRSLFKAIDVHGSDKGRLENINNALTSLKQEKGGFTTHSSSNWKDFQKQFNQAFKKDGYESYLDQIFKQKAGRNDYSKIPLKKTLDILISEIDAGHINNEVRIAEMIDIVSKSSRGGIGSRVQDYLYPLIKRDRIQVLAEHYFEAVKKQAKVKKISELPDEALQNLSSVLDDLRRNTVYFKPFGEFAAVDRKLQEFIAAEDVDAAAAAAAAIKDDVLTYAEMNLGKDIQFSRFDKSQLTEKTAIGQKLPWHAHLDWIPLNEDIRSVMNFAFDLEDKRSMMKIMHNSLASVDLEFSVFTDKKGIIIATGNEAQRLQDEENDKQISKSTREIIMKKSEIFYDKLEALNHFAEYSRGNLSAQELKEYWDDYTFERNKKGVAVDFQALVSNLCEYREDNFMGAEHFEALKASPAYQEFMVGDPFVEKFFEHHKNSSSVGAAAVAAAGDIGCNKSYLNKISNVVLKFLEETAQPPENFYFQAIHLSGRMLDDYISQADDRAPSLTEEAIARGKEIAGSFSQYQEQLRLHALKYIAPQNLVNEINQNRYNVLEQIHDAVGRAKPMPYADLICSRFGLETPHDNESLFRVLWEIRKNQSHYYTNTPLAHEFMWKYLQNLDLPVLDLRNLAPLPRCLDVSGREGVSTFYFDSYRNLLGSYIEKHALFPSTSIYDDILIYENMTEKELFSSELSNREKFLDSIVGRFNQVEPQKREEYAFKLLSQQYIFNERHNSERTLPFAPAKEKLMNIWVNEVFKRLGKDDGSPEYLQKVKETISEFDTRFGDKYHERPALMQADKNKILRRLSDKIVSKKALSEFLGSQSISQISAQEMEKNDVYGRGFEAMMSILQHNPDRCDLTIQFLNTKLTPQSIKAFQKDITKGYKFGKNPFNTESLEILHKTFWSESLEVRAVVMNKLLNRYSPDIDKQIDYVCNMHFASDDPYRKDAELIFKTVINSFEPFERGLVLSAMASANENRDEEHQKASKSVGKGLAMFFENMGPAWVKFGQLLSYVPDLPSEIREHLAKLKDKADIPPRWEIYKSINDTLPSEVAANIKDVGKILGAGSFWVTTEVLWHDPQSGKTEPKVLSLLRPYAVEKFAAGDKIILESVKKLGKADSKYQQLYKIAEQASISGRLETDVGYGFKQLQKAREIYGGLEVFVGDTSVKSEVADWIYFGTGRNGCAYKLMDKAAGESLTSNKHTLEDKKTMAMAYTTIELTNLLRGEVWDTDRHSGQQNFSALNDNGMKKFIVGIFDTGAQMRDKPDTKDKVLLGELLYGMIRAARNGKDMNDYMFKKIKKLDKLNKLNIDTKYIAEVQRGLTALSDIMEYQKEIKDKDGKIIQERRSLQAEDMQQIANAVLESCLMDKSVKQTLTVKALLNKFRPLREGWASSLMEGLKKSAENSVGISYHPQETSSRGSQYDKPQKEISLIEQQERKGQILGVDKQRIKSENGTSEIQMTRIMAQKGRRA